MLPDVLEAFRQGTTWHSRAACRGRPSRMFIPVVGEWCRSDTKTALECCDECPVRQECGRYAETHDIWFGVWGGRMRGQVDGKRGEQ